MITLGGTREKIDNIRYIGNFSSGKQGLAIAKRCQEYGAKVTIVKGNTDIKIPAFIKSINILSADDMLKAVLLEIKKQEFDFAFFVAAVADFKIEQPIEGKIKKDKTEKLNLTLVKTPDVLQQVSLNKYRPKKVIGFALESENYLQNAKKKLLEKKCDYIILNKLAKGKVFGSEKNQNYCNNKE